MLLFISPLYLLGCLFSDRKDKSVLFWKSLPVSETRVVLTKLAYGALLGPALFLLASLVVGLLHLLMMLGYAAMELGVNTSHSCRRAASSTTKSPFMFTSHAFCGTPSAVAERIAARW